MISREEEVASKTAYIPHMKMHIKSSKNNQGRGYSLNI
jgi:hypothetical protein